MSQNKRGHDLEAGQDGERAKRVSRIHQDEQARAQASACYGDEGGHARIGAVSFQAGEDERCRGEQQASCGNAGEQQEADDVEAPGDVVAQVCHVQALHGLEDEAGGSCKGERSEYPKQDGGRGAFDRGRFSH
ncbi:MAG: hypothetical protein V8S24_02085 [Gordonibacter pamelaeae]